MPHTLVGRPLDLRYTATTVEAFHQGQRVASHARSALRGRHTTVDGHMPPHHQFAKWSPQRFTQWAEQTGPATAQRVIAILQSRRHVEQGYRACLGILRLGDRFSKPRLEAACQRALSRRAKLGISCRVQVPVGQGLATHPYRVLGPWRSRLLAANKAGEA